MKTILLSILVTLFSFSISAGQIPPVKQWDASFGGSEFDELHSVRQTIDGGYILGGYSYSDSSGDKTQKSRGGADYWIVKTDSLGVKEWDARFGGSSDDFLISLQQTKDGGYILGGYSFSAIGGDKTQDEGSIDYWIVKTNANGIKQWDAVYGGSAEDYLEDLQLTSDGGYILGGYSKSGISGDKTQESRGFDDYWMVKIDSNGVKQWDATFGGTGEDYLRAIQQTTDGGYILGGWSLSGKGGDKTQWGRGENDYWIVKTDSNGIKVWDARFGGNNTDSFRDLEQTSDGGYILGGDSYSEISGDKTEVSKGYNDYWIVKINSNGKRQWDADFGADQAEYFHSIVQTSDGGYLVAGFSFSGINGDKTQANIGAHDYWIVKTDSEGVKKWDADFGGSKYDYLFSCEQTSDGGYILGGQSDSGITGDKTQPSQGGLDYWIVKTSAEEQSDCPPPTGLFASDVTATSAALNWTPVIGAEEYRIRYKVSGTDSVITKITVSTFLELNDLSPNTKYAWAAKARCASDTTSEISSKQYFTTASQKMSNVSELIVDVYPNPASENVFVNYSLSSPATVKVELFDVLGNKLQEMSNELDAGEHRKVINTREFSNGVYYLKIQAGEHISSQKIVVMK